MHNTNTHTHTHTHTYTHTYIHTHIHVLTENADVRLNICHKTKPDAAIGLCTQHVLQQYSIKACFGNTVANYKSY